MQIVVRKTEGGVAPVVAVLDTSEEERRRAESLALLDKGVAALERELDAARGRRPPDVGEALEIQNRVAARRAERARLAAAPLPEVRPAGEGEESILLPGASAPPGPPELLDFDKRAGALVVNAERAEAARGRAEEARAVREAWALRRARRRGTQEQDLTPETIRDLVFVLAREAGLL